MSRIGLTLPVRSPEAKTRRGRRFEPGNTMAKGRPKGRLNKTTVFVQGLFNEHAPEVAQKVIALAKAGDPNAVRIVMDRVCPVRAGAPVRWDMPIIRHTDDIRTAYSKAIADGELSPVEGLPVLRILDATAKVFDFQVDPECQPDTTTTIERLTKQEDESAKAAEARQKEAA